MAFNDDLDDLFGEDAFQDAEFSYPPPPSPTWGPRQPNDMPSADANTTAVNTGQQPSSGLALPQPLPQSQLDPQLLPLPQAQPPTQPQPQTQLPPLPQHQTQAPPRPVPAPLSQLAAPLVQRPQPPQPSPVTTTGGPSRVPPPGARISHARKKNTPNRIDQYDWYRPLPPRENWVATRLGSDPVNITYTTSGEFTPSLHFDREALEMYAIGCYSRNIPLRVWVQNSASMHSERFLSNASHRCRAKECPIPSRVINRGIFQVSLDEHPQETSNGTYDPFHVAGCFHLFCLEEMMSLSELMTLTDVRADFRVLPLEEKNPMSLQRDGIQAVLNAYNEWKWKWHDEYSVRNMPVPSTRRRPSERLFCVLTKSMIASQPEARQRKRDQRDGNDISKHKGNLRKLMEAKSQVKKARRAQSKAAKRRASDLDEDGLSDARPAKRVHADNRSAAGRAQRDRHRATGSSSSSSVVLAAAAAAAAAPLLQTSDRMLLSRLNAIMSGAGGGGAGEGPQQQLLQEISVHEYQRLQTILEDYRRAYSDQMQQPPVAPSPPARARQESPYNLRDTPARRDSSPHQAHQVHELQPLLDLLSASQEQQTQQTQQTQQMPQPVQLMPQPMQQQMLDPMLQPLAQPVEHEPVLASAAQEQPAATNVIPDDFIDPILTPHGNQGTYVPTAEAASESAGAVDRRVTRSMSRNRSSGEEQSVSGEQQSAPAEQDQAEAAQNNVQAAVQGELGSADIGGPSDQPVQYEYDWDNFLATGDLSTFKFDGEPVDLENVTFDDLDPTLFDMLPAQQTQSATASPCWQSPAMEAGQPESGQPESGQPDKGKSPLKRSIDFPADGQPPAKRTARSF